MSASEQADSWEVEFDDLEWYWILGPGCWLIAMDFSWSQLSKVTTIV